jgi:hypothetical protein
MELSYKLGIYDIGTGIQTSFSGIVDIIHEHLGTDIRANYVDNPITTYMHDGC